LILITVWLPRLVRGQCPGHHKLLHRLRNLAQIRLLHLIREGGDGHASYCAVGRTRTVLLRLFRNRRYDDLIEGIAHNAFDIDVLLEALQVVLMVGVPVYARRRKERPQSAA